MMSTKENVLVFSSAGYPAIQIIDSLKNNPLFHVIAAASYPNHAEFVCQDTIIDLPFIRDPRFIKTLHDIIQERNIHYIIPTDDSIAMVLKEHELELQTKVVCSPFETTRLCRYKNLAYAALAGEVYIPDIYNYIDLDDTAHYPLFVKPIVGEGSRGARLVHSKEELDQVENLEDMVISEYLPGEEYTVDCFTNKERKLIFCNPRVRTRLMNGITVRGHDIPCDDEFTSVINRLNDKIHFRGYWFAQLRRDKTGKLKLLEVCTRFSGSFAISKGKGVNLPLLALCDFSGRQADIVLNNYTVECDKTYIDRYRINIHYDCLYVDYDDTVTSQHGTEVNSYVMAYLYQCRNKGKRIILITRHKDTFHEDLKHSFQRLGISDILFDEIIELDWNQEKYNVMKCESASIFLDNSFAERKKVHDRLGIPVFDITNIDCLFDWRQ